MFVFEVPIPLHNEYHSKIHDIPLPSGKTLKSLWQKYQQEKQWLHTTDIVGACNWLIANADDRDFRWAMIQQKNFFLRSGLY